VQEDQVPDGDDDSELHHDRELHHSAPPLYLAGCDDEENGEPHVVRGID
jgi:hypothetical protein